MVIGIDISQTAYDGTGVGEYLYQLVKHITSIDTKNKYILFFSSLRNDIPVNMRNIVRGNDNITINHFKFPPIFLDFVWNRLHILPIEWLIKDVDIFISSDWTQPPTIRAKKITILYDLIVYKFPKETAKKIVQTQKRRLAWVKKECIMILCISEATKKDAKEILHIEENRLVVTYPGF